MVPSIFIVAVALIGGLFSSLPVIEPSTQLAATSASQLTAWIKAKAPMSGFSGGGSTLTGYAPDPRDRMRIKRVSIHIDCALGATEETRSDMDALRTMRSWAAGKNGCNKNAEDAEIVEENDLNKLSPTEALQELQKLLEQGGALAQQAQQVMDLLKQFGGGGGGGQPSSGTGTKEPDWQSSNQYDTQFNDLAKSFGLSNQITLDDIQSALSQAGLSYSSLGFGGNTQKTVGDTIGKVIADKQNLDNLFGSGQSKSDQEKALVGITSIESQKAAVRELMKQQSAKEKELLDQFNALPQEQQTAAMMDVVFPKEVYQVGDALTQLDQNLNETLSGARQAYSKGDYPAVAAAATAAAKATDLAAIISAGTNSSLSNLLLIDDQIIIFGSNAAGSALSRAAQNISMARFYSAVRALTTPRGSVLANQNSFNALEQELALAHKNAGMAAVYIRANQIVSIAQQENRDAFLDITPRDINTLYVEYGIRQSLSSMLKREAAGVNSGIVNLNLDGYSAQNLDTNYSSQLEDEFYEENTFTDSDYEFNFEAKQQKEANFFGRFFGSVVNWFKGI